MLSRAGAAEVGRREPSLCRVAFQAADDEATARHGLEMVFMNTVLIAASPRAFGRWANEAASFFRLLHAQARAIWYTSCGASARSFCCRWRPAEGRRPLDLPGLAPYAPV